MRKLSVSIIIIALNEEKSLPMLLNDLSTQSYEHKNIQLILVDGMSKDKTREIMISYRDNSDFSNVTVLDNPRVLQASGWNVALNYIDNNSTFETDVIIRLDAHASIPNDFIEKNIRYISEGKDICGGKVTNYITDDSVIGRITNMSESSMFGGSIAAFRHKDESGYVSTLAFAAYKKQVFDRVGLFNENLARTEDNEIHYRMRKAGYLFYYTPDIQSSRETRPNFIKLLKQKFLNGYWIGLTLGVCPQCFSIYHFIPFLFVLAIIFTTIIAVGGIWHFSLLLWSLYFIVTIIMSIATIISEKFIHPLCSLLPFMFLLLHVEYGLGTLCGIIKMPYWKKLK